MNSDNYTLKAVFSELVLNGKVSRTEIVRKYRIRQATVTAAAERLKRRGILSEPGRTGKHTGRRASELYFSRRIGTFTGIELTPTAVRAVLTDGSGTELRHAEAAVSQEDTAIDLQNRILSVWRTIDRSRESLIGFADPGVPDLESGVSLQAVNLPAWEGVGIRSFLSRHTADPSPFILPETAAKTYAEYLDCAPVPPGTLFHASFGDGVGAGYISGGELFGSRRFKTMELGHLVMSSGGRRCRCGNRGCLEAMVGTAALREMARELAVSGVTTSLDLEHFTLANFVAAANANDRAALVLAQETCERIAPAIAIVVTLLNPEMIVLSGELTGLGALLLDSIRRTMARRCLMQTLEKIQLKISTLNEYAVALTAARLRRNAFLEQELDLRDYAPVLPLTAGI